MSVLLQNKRNTRAEFKRLKTILPSIRRKDNVSKLDIILEAIKYIDDLQDQLIDRLGGPRGDREATILALTAQASQNGDARLKDVEDDVFDDVFDHDGDADADDEDLISLNDGYMSDPGLLMLYQEDEDQDSDLDGDCSSGVSHASLELWSSSAKRCSKNSKDIPFWKIFHSSYDYYLISDHKSGQKWIRNPELDLYSRSVFLRLLRPEFLCNFFKHFFVDRYFFLSPTFHIFVLQHFLSLNPLFSAEKKFNKIFLWYLNTIKFTKNLSSPPPKILEQVI